MATAISSTPTIIIHCTATSVLQRNRHIALQTVKFLIQKERKKKKRREKRK
jgi:hypothetical protein